MESWTEIIYVNHLKSWLDNKLKHMKYPPQKSAEGIFLFYNMEGKYGFYLRFKDIFYTLI
jgi:hypothetical protein